MPINPDAQALLDGLAALELPPFEQLPIDVQRSMFDEPPPDGPEPPPIHASADRTVPGPAGDIPVRVYHPSDEPGLPAIVYYHGGGWVLGGLNGHDGLCRAIANACSSVVVSVDYRRAPEDPYPAAFDDSFAVTKWVADNGAALNADTSRLVVAGDSAGGNLAAAVALAARSDGLALTAQILIYPVTDLAEPKTESYERNGEGLLLTQGWMSWFIDQYVPDTAQRSDELASPMLAASHEALPPALVITAEFDPLLDDGTAYAAKLAAAGVDTEHVNYSGNLHGFVSSIGIIADADVAVAKIAEFLTARS